MPNTRRRRFSVQNDIATRDPSKTQSGTSNKSKIKNKVFANSSKNINTLDVVTECDSITSILTVKKRSITTMDKEVITSSSNIPVDLFIISDKTAETNPVQAEEITHLKGFKNKRDESIPQRDTHITQIRSNQRQHRIKVRSPRRRITMLEQCKTNENNKRSIGIAVIDWTQDVEAIIVEQVQQEQEIEDVDTTEYPRPNNDNLVEMCRICHGGEELSSELGSLISTCSCRGTVGMVHVKCLERWLTESGKSRCELCGTRYLTRRVHKYGVPRALIMWILRRNSKQLMVDILGIMLMSPLAVLAAWLSGRTLAGLMSQESHVTSWPLASTFVLACMTLVCYYCWIVSAATRHALGWWVWYRSQYEIRLQDNEE